MGGMENTPQKALIEAARAVIQTRSQPYTREELASALHTLSEATKAAEEAEGAGPEKTPDKAWWTQHPVDALKYCMREMGEEMNADVERQLREITDAPAEMQGLEARVRELMSTEAQIREILPDWIVGPGLVGGVREMAERIALREDEELEAKLAKMRAVLATFFEKVHELRDCDDEREGVGL